MSPDPHAGSYDWTNPQSLNRYAYVLINPLGAIDPNGLDLDQVTCQSEHDCGGGTVGCDPNCSDQFCNVYTSNGNGGISGGTGWVNTSPESGDCFFCSIFSTTTGSGGSGAGSGSQAGSPAPKSALLHKIGCSIASPVLGLARSSNHVIGIGAGGSAGAGFPILGIFGSFEIQIVADPHGNVGIAVNGTLSFGGFGIGAQGGAQLSASTARNISALSGPGIDAGASFGPIGLDVSHGLPEGPYTGTLTIGPGVGGKVSGAVTTAGTGIPISTNCNGMLP